MKTLTTKTWLYHGDVNPEHGGNWTYRADLVDCSDLVGVVSVEPVSDGCEDNVFMVSESSVFIPSRQESWVGACRCMDAIGLLTALAIEGDTERYWAEVTQVFLGYFGPEAETYCIVAIGKSADEVQGFTVTDRVRSGRIENYINKHFLAS